MQETHPPTDALTALAAAYAERLDRHTPFSGISRDVLQSAFDAWRGTHPDAAQTPEHARRGVFRYDLRRPDDLRALADALLSVGDPLAAAAVHAERARLEDPLSRETRTRRAETEYVVAGLLEQAGRPHDALRAYVSAVEGFAADPGRAEAARACQEAALRIEGAEDVHAEASRVARERRSVHAANAVAAERARRARELAGFHRDGRSTNGVHRPEFQSTDRLFELLRRHLGDEDHAKAEVVSWEIADRMSHQEPGFLSLLNQTTLAELLEARTAPHAAEGLREGVYLSSVRLYGHSDPRTLEAALRYVDNLKSTEAYATAFRVARHALRKAYAGRVREVLRSLRPGRGAAPSVSGEPFRAAVRPLELSAQLAGARADLAEAGMEDRRTSERVQGPPRLYTNTGHRLRDAFGGPARGGGARGEAPRPRMTLPGPGARRARR
ncbi:hypothetical protein [Nocardiopsis dassonvillei]|uniref:hypothetical protein n=1 Tax=Nocardiopsis dassonvillei TaxID=2014 RepID=UPI0033C67DA1